MARGAALTGSLVVHAIALAAIVGPSAHRPRRPTSRADRTASPVAIELTAPVSPSPLPSPSPDAASRSPNAASRAPDAASRSPAAAGRSPSPPAAAAVSSARVETTLQIEPIPAGAVASAGSAGPTRGIGFGDGGGIAPPVDTARLATPEPPRPSQARPPRLRWPMQHAEVADQPLFVARITVDRDGFVAAARLVQSSGGPAAAHAADAIWRFRYDPALDDDGHPVAAAIDQPFLLR